VADYEENGPREENEPESAGAQEKPIPGDWNRINGIHPRTGKPCQYYIQTRTLSLVGKKRSKGAALELGELVPYTIQARGLKATWRGLTDWDGEEGDTDWYFIVSNPTYAYDHKSGLKCDPWKGQVFFVVTDGDLLIRWWGWCDADPDDPRLPEGHDQGRFLERIF
jgi:hypothetical protein